MAFQTMGVPFKLTPEDMGQFDLMGALSAGQQFGQKQRMFPQELQQAILANKMKEAELPYAGQMARSTAAYKEAMAKYLSSPQQALRHLSPLGKTYIEPAIIDAILKERGYKNTKPGQGFNYEQPNEDLPIEGQEGEDAYGAYGLQRQKMSTDAQARSRNLSATNIEKTIDYIDPDALTQYGGLKGSIERGKEGFKSAFGKESEGYDNYIKSKNAVKLLVKQVRQFYGDSIQPSMQQNLETILDATNWQTNPKLAKEIFDQTVDILRNELGTYRQAMKSKSVYTGENTGLGNSKAVSNKLKESNQLPEGKVEETKQIGKINYVKIKGQWYEQ